MVFRQGAGGEELRMSIWDVASRMADEKGHVDITRHVLRDMYDEAFAAGRAEGVMEGAESALRVLGKSIQNMNIREDVRRATSTQGQNPEGTQARG